MSDIFSKAKRHDIMSKIFGKDTKPEIIVRKFLYANGFRFRKNDKRYPGKPDIVVPKLKTAIFIHGCFWHGHTNCTAAALPQSNRVFWEDKISKTVLRDQKKKTELEQLNWRVIVIWQCEIKTFEKRKSRFELLLHELSENDWPTKTSQPQ